MVQDTTVYSVYNDDQCIICFVQVGLPFTSSGCKVQILLRQPEAETGEDRGTTEGVARGRDHRFQRGSHQRQN